MIKQSEQEYKIILFDGICNFCNYWVNFILARDKKDQFRFATLQSQKGQEILLKLNLPQNNFDSLIFISGNEFKKKSLAVFEIAKTLGGSVRLINFFRFLPPTFTDFIYDLIAENRYKIFGKRNHCRIPSEEERAKFL